MNATGTRPAVALFDRIVVGVDGSEESLEAAAQAARLREEGGRLELVSVVNLAEAALAGPWAPRLAGELEADADAALRRAAELAPQATGVRRLTGPAADVLLEELERSRATLVAIGGGRHGRAAAALFGDLTRTLLRGARCSVLVARPPGEGRDRFPRAIVVGVDGSECAARAAEAAAALAERLAVPLRHVSAADAVDAGAVRAAHPRVEVLPGEPAAVLLEAAEQADLLVVGCRGLHGLRALGSVSDRVAHAAPCSVLVVRTAGAAT